MSTSAHVEGGYGTDETGRSESVGFAATLAGEWIKARTSKGVRRNIVLGLLLGVAFSALLSWILGATFDDWAASDVATFNAIEATLAGGLFTAIFFSAAAVNFVATEYTSQMIRLTFSVTPRRTRVIVAKAVVIGVVTLAASLIATFLMLLLGKVIMGAYDVPVYSMGDGTVWETILLVGIVGPFFPVLAVFLTFMLRSTAASLSTVLAVIFVPAMFGGLFPRWWQENVIAALPGPASDSVALSHITDSDMYLSRGLAAVVTVAWVVVLFVVARALVQRRDA